MPNTQTTAQGSFRTAGTDRPARAVAAPTPIGRPEANLSARAALHPARKDPRMTPRLTRASWPDPDDTNPLRREARKIDGMRAYDVISAIHAQNPKTWTAHHVEAAVRLRRDYEVGIQGASSAGGRGMVEARSPDGRMVARIDTATAYREAMDALGRSAAWDVRRLVLDNWTLAEIAARDNVGASRVSGRVEAAMTRLVEHYGIDRRNGRE